MKGFEILPVSFSDQLAGYWLVSIYYNGQASWLITLTLLERTKWQTFLFSQRLSYLTSIVIAYCFAIWGFQPLWLFIGLFFSKSCWPFLFLNRPQRRESFVPMHVVKIVVLIRGLDPDLSSWSNFNVNLIDDNVIIWFKTVLKKMLVVHLIRKSISK